MAGGGVVVGQRDDVQPGRGGAADYLSGRVRPVGGVAVHVQIGAHSVLSFT
jgi:hypothetical protein